MDYKNLSIEKLKTIISKANQELERRHNVKKQEAIEKIKSMIQEVETLRSEFDIEMDLGCDNSIYNDFLTENIRIEGEYIIETNLCYMDE